MVSTSLSIVCVNFLHYLDDHGLLVHGKDQWNCYCDLQGTPSLKVAIGVFDPEETSSLVRRMSSVL